MDLWFEMELAIIKSGVAVHGECMRAYTYFRNLDYNVHDDGSGAILISDPDDEDVYIYLAPGRVIDRMRQTGKKPDYEVIEAE